MRQLQSTLNIQWVIFCVKSSNNGLKFRQAYITPLTVSVAYIYSCCWLFIICMLATTLFCLQKTHFILSITRCEKLCSMRQRNPATTVIAISLFRFTKQVIEEVAERLYFAAAESLGKMAQAVNLAGIIRSCVQAQTPFLLRVSPSPSRYRDKIKIIPVTSPAVFFCRHIAIETIFYSCQRMKQECTETVQLCQGLPNSNSQHVKRCSVIYFFKKHTPGKSGEK